LLCIFPDTGLAISLTGLILAITVPSYKVLGCEETFISRSGISLLVLTRVLPTNALSDFGRTSIIKHEIEVQNARPVKEPPRRVSYHLQGEYDTAIQDMLNFGTLFRGQILD
jgi:hypothetical protein